MISLNFHRSVLDMSAHDTEVILLLFAGHFWDLEIEFLASLFRFRIFNRDKFKNFFLHNWKLEMLGYILDFTYFLNLAIVLKNLMLCDTYFLSSSY